MKTLRNMVMITIALVVFHTTSWAINNPADMTSSYGQIPMEFYKICSDAGGSHWFDVSFPVNEKKDANIYFDNWVSKSGEDKALGVITSKSFSNRFQLTFSHYSFWGESGSSATQDLWVDKGWENGGFNILLPLQPGGDPTYGVRQKVDKTHFFLQYAKSTEDFNYGVSFEIKGGISLDLAYQENSENKYLRISKLIHAKSGIFIPEIRVKANDTGYIGFGLGFVPN